VHPAASAHLVVRSVAVDDPGPLLSLLPREGAFAWLRHGEGLVGWGAALRLETKGPDRFADAELWWREVVGHAVVRDDVGLPGSGLVAFASFAFDPAGDARSVAVVPSVVVGRRGDRWFVTTVGEGSLPGGVELSPSEAAERPEDVVFADGARSGADWGGAVAEAVRRIGAGELEKVVLARDLVAEASEPVDPRWPLARLAADYEACWTFSVDGLIGATPEMLVRLEKGLVTSRVLAGTIRRTGDDAHDLALAARLARSSKDLEEHEYAVRSVAEALAPHCSSTNVPETPFVLHLPNVMHLATDVAGVVRDGSTALGLAAALHPSAAVCGTPTDVALETIRDLEGMERGRYAGPVGWFDSVGDGEFGIALRCAEVTGRRVRLFAGCGIVAGSDPEAELAEAQAKFIAMRDALGA
jgi:menaquinone-specific isochorismate synthase